MTINVLTNYSELGQPYKAVKFGYFKISLSAITFQPVTFEMLGKEDFRVYKISPSHLPNTLEKKLATYLLLFAVVVLKENAKDKNSHLYDKVRKLRRCYTFLG